MNHAFCAVVFLVCCVLGQAVEVVTYPAAEGEPLPTQYHVEAEGLSVPVYGARVLDPPFAGKEYDYGGPYSFASFDVNGPVEVRIRSEKVLSNLVVRPSNPKIKVQVTGPNTAIVSLPGPCKMSLEPDGKKGPLLLFADPIEPTQPKPGDAGPKLVYFGPGVHRPGKLSLTNGQSMFLAGGAVVKGGIVAEGNDIRIFGRGILDGSDWEWLKGPTSATIAIRGTNVEVSGITIRGSAHWTIVPRSSRHVTVRNVKLCGSRVQNDDGVNPCNSQDVLITDCFIRSDDDCVAMKGLDLASPNNNVERVTVENCILWCDRARIFLLGHESRAAYMRDITLRNLDLIHFSMTAFLFEPGEEMRLVNVRTENIRIHGEGQGELIRLKPVVNQYMRNKVPGYVADIEFKNLSVEGKPGGYRIQLSGADAQHDVQNVTFENVEILGKKLQQGSERLELGPNVKEVRFR